MKNAQCMKAANDRHAKVVVPTLKFMSFVIFIWLLISLSEDYLRVNLSRLWELKQHLDFSGVFWMLLYGRETWSTFFDLFPFTHNTAARYFIFTVWRLANKPLFERWSRENERGADESFVKLWTNQNRLLKSLRRLWHVRLYWSGVVRFNNFMLACSCNHI